MSVPKGNAYWKLRNKHGRDKKFETPEILWDTACEYFEWIDKNPWKLNEVLRSGQKAGRVVKIPTQRPYTLTGLFVFLEINRKTWDLYRERNDFIPVVGHIEDIMYTQKFEGASIGAFNPNIIARDLGLIDKSDLTSLGKKINDPLTDLILALNTKKRNDKPG